jgi:hypothetical protein
LFAVIVGDVAILAVAVTGVVLVSGSAGAKQSTALVSILTAAFTAIGTLTTAYFGIKAAANTAKSTYGHPPAAPTTTVPPTGQ